MLFGVMLAGWHVAVALATGMLVIGYSVAQFAAAHTGACTRLSAGSTTAPRPRLWGRVRRRGRRCRGARARVLADADAASAGARRCSAPPLPRGRRHHRQCRARRCDRGWLPRAAAARDAGAEGAPLHPLDDVTPARRCRAARRAARVADVLARRAPSRLAARSRTARSTPQPSSARRRATPRGRRSPARSARSAALAGGLRARRARARRPRARWRSRASASPPPCCGSRRRRRRAVRRAVAALPERQRSSIFLSIEFVERDDLGLRPPVAGRPLSTSSASRTSSPSVKVPFFAQGGLIEARPPATRR